ncbi:hypothetical protein RIF29_39805 [Crotalaria pallida]|uniref:Uncharacterized protein n=1 Tax=Crotalaria pallida TaxID=3830 RepID=A0AAN9E3J9_CROPI
MDRARGSALCLSGSVFVACASQSLSARDSGHLNLLPQETSSVLKEPVGVVYTEDSTNTKNLPRGSA